LAVASAPGTLPAKGPFSRLGAEGGKERDMNLVVWLPAMFLVGLVGMGLCLAFVIACEKI
jgi:hypothetical protein